MAINSNSRHWYLLVKKATSGQPRLLLKPQLRICLILLLLPRRLHQRLPHLCRRRTPSLCFRLKLSSNHRLSSNDRLSSNHRLSSISNINNKLLCQQQYQGHLRML